MTQTKNNENPSENMFWFNEKDVYLNYEHRSRAAYSDLLHI